MTEQLTSIVEKTPSRKSLTFAIFFIVLWLVTAGVVLGGAWSIYQHLILSRQW